MGHEFSSPQKDTKQQLLTTRLPQKEFNPCRSKQPNRAETVVADWLPFFR